ncbi:MAG TPA: HTH domain-containing protein [Petrimonas sp.]|nr:HTH domain-containing protein [Petrimonas sp.]
MVQKGCRKGAENEARNEARNEAEEVITTRQLQVLELIKKNNKISRERISKLLKVSESFIYRDIEKLKNIGKLERKGSTKSGYWEIK